MTLLSDRLTDYAELPAMVQGDSLTVPVTFSDEQGTPVDITGWTVSFTVSDDTGILINKDQTTHADSTNGKAVFGLVPSDTAGLIGRKRYDIQIEKSDGTIRTVVIGTIRIIDEVTEDP